MDLVIARNAPPAVIVHKAGVPHLVRIGAGERRRSAHQPDLVLRRRLGQEVLDRAAPVFFAHDHLVAVAQSKDAKILGQRHELRALARRPRDQLAGDGKIGLDLRIGHHLHRRYLESAFSHRSFPLIRSTYLSARSICPLVLLVRSFYLSTQSISFRPRRCVAARAKSSPPSDRSRCRLFRTRKRRPAPADP